MFVLTLNFFFRELQAPATQPMAWKKEGRFKKKRKEMEKQEDNPESKETGASYLQI